MMRQPYFSEEWGLNIQVAGIGVLTLGEGYLDDRKLRRY